MPQCCFAGCHNRTDDGRGLSFFRFPRRDLARTAAWVVACGRKDFSPSQHSRVCSRHFSAVDFDRDARHDSNGGVHRRLRLKDTAVPTTNPVDNPWQNTDNMVGRKSKSRDNSNVIAKLFPSAPPGELEFFLYHDKNLMPVLAFVRVSDWLCEIRISVITHEMGLITCCDLLSVLRCLSKF